MLNGVSLNEQSDGMHKCAFAKLFLFSSFFFFVGVKLTYYFKPTYLEYNRYQTF